LMGNGDGFTPFGEDLFGDKARRPLAPLASRFVIPPFSVLDARKGEWQDRKRAWLSLGIRSELGRSGLAKTYNTGKNLNASLAVQAAVKREKARAIPGGGGGKNSAYMWRTDEGYEASDEAQAVGTGTSIFDPVLCEVICRWFSGNGAQIVDPFAGGSVRGVVASCLGRKYWGSELRLEQVEANREQGLELCPEAARISIIVSGAMLRQMFHPCEANFITGTCRGRCCESSGGIMVAVHATEQAAIEAKGATVQNGFIVADSRGLCPFKTDDGFCGIHGREKPFGCQASPFTLNDNGTLIVRNRYRALKCYACEGALPAYQAHAWSLEAVLGKAEAERVSLLAAQGAEQIHATIAQREYAMLVDNDDAKHGRTTPKLKPSMEYVCGDSKDTLGGAPDADLVFSCPPYGDLESYSDDPSDLSNMDWPGFTSAYLRIISLSADRLKPNRFACFVVGNFRDDAGHYHDLVSLTTSAFAACGMPLYNEAVLITSIGSLPVRVGKQFEVNRKLGKSHQNILVFVKGDWRQAANACRTGYPVVPEEPDEPYAPEMPETSDTEAEMIKTAPTPQSYYQGALPF
jgi:hypothetical protein